MVGLSGNENSISQILHRLSDHFFMSVQLGGIDQRNATLYHISKQINSTSISIRPKADLREHNTALSQFLALHADSSRPGCDGLSGGAASSELFLQILVPRRHVEASPVSHSLAQLLQPMAGVLDFLFREGRVRRNEDRFVLARVLSRYKHRL